MNRPAPLVSLLVALCLLPAVSSFPVDAQSSAGAPQTSGAWALVGARIVDGSGNEPFEGVIVVRDGRIVEAGRSVKPPADVRVIDAQGRTVTTGLIDLHVQLPAGASDDQIARALAAYAYAGVTTVAIGGVEPGGFDALRDKLIAKGLSAPRLVAARAEGAAAVAPGLARAAQPAQRKPTALLGEMLSPTRFQRAQAANDAAAAGDAAASGGGAVGGGAPAASTAPMAPAASAASPASASGDASRWQAAVDRTKALRTANVRLAIASGAGEGGLPHGWSSLLEARLLGDAGLTPLQAVTAATSGGAWALGLQSDRAFIAVGQRADLVVFNGNPTASLGDIEKIERVFVAGQEIDRAALKTFLTRDDPPPPAPAVTMPADTTASATPAAGSTRGAAARKGRRGKNDPAAGAAAGAGAPGTGTTGAASGASPSSAAAAASGTPAAGTPASGAPGSPSSAPAATPGTPGSSTASPASPGTTTSGTAASSSGASSAPGTAAASTSGTSATPGTAGTAATTTTAGAAAASTTTAATTTAGTVAAAAGVAPETPLIDDFEGAAARDHLGVAWQTTGDESTRASAIIAGRVVRGLRDHALHLTARMGDASQPYAAVNVRVAGENGRPADVSHFRGVRFDARGEGRYRIVFVTRGVTDGHYHVTYFSGSPNWTPVSVPFASIGQNGSSGSKTVPWTGRDLIEISFQVARDPGQMGWMELDNIRFY